jgi:hypothetical protein
MTEHALADTEHHALVSPDEQFEGSFIVLAQESLQQRHVGDCSARGNNRPAQMP